MAKECLEYCPRIIRARKVAVMADIMSVPSSDGLLFPAPSASNERAQEVLREEMEAAGNCEGPVIEGVNYVTRGLFRRKVATEIVWMCGLDPENAPSTIDTGSAVFSKVKPVGPPGLLEAVSEVARDYPLGFYSALLDLVLGKGEFANKK